MKRTSIYPNVCNYLVVDTPYTFEKTECFKKQYTKCGECLLFVSQCRVFSHTISVNTPIVTSRRVQFKRDGTRRRTGGEVKGKLANGVGSQYSSHYLGTWCIQHYYR